MRYLGVAQTITHNGSLIIRAEFAPPIGTEVITNRLEPVGVVTEILGPVNAPYVKMKPSAIKGRKMVRLIDNKLYTR
jgi:rRNA processing protein Gar1